MLVGDFLDAYIGFNNQENERFKVIAALIRTSTTLLWNIQVAREDRLPEHKLWPLPWDKNEGGIIIINDEERKKIEELHEKILNNLNNGNSNNKS